MSKQRKTVDVSYVLGKANVLLARKDVSEEYRKGVASLLECVLHETGNYQGFNYLDWLERGHKAWQEQCAHEANDKLDTDPYLGDKSRRVYHGTTLSKKELAEKSIEQYPRKLR